MTFFPKNLIFFLALASINLCTANRCFGETNFNLITVAQPGQFYHATLYSHAFIYANKKNSKIFSGVNNGHIFFDINNDKKSFIVSDLIDLQTKEFFLPKNIKLTVRKIIYADCKQIIFSASRKDIFPQTQVYSFDINTEKTHEVPLKLTGYGYASYLSERYYFSNFDDDIMLYNQGKNTHIGIKGEYPTISPDETKIAFLTSALLSKNKLVVYDLKTKKSLTIATGIIQNHFSWSPDSTLLSYRHENDLWLSPIRIYSLKSKKIIKKIKTPGVKNWFFIKSDQVK